MDDTKKFSGLADVYTIGRPAYAKAFIDFLYQQHGCSEQAVIADIGSGTGKFAKSLLERGSTVYCVEPNDDMREKSVQELSGFEKFHAVNGTASETALHDHYVDLITTAQAFHWFDVPLFAKECRRILKENGMVFLIWNMRDMCSEINQRTYEIYRKYCPAFRGFGGGIQKDDSRIRQFFDGMYHYVEFDHPLFYTGKEAFINRSLSGSYSLKAGDAGYSEYIDELSALYEQYAEDGILTMPNKTTAYFGRLKNNVRMDYVL